jgi:hypothetical protein
MIAVAADAADEDACVNWSLPAWESVIFISFVNSKCQLTF